MDYKAAREKAITLMCDKAVEQYRYEKYEEQKGNERA